MGRRILTLVVLLLLSAAAVYGVIHYTTVVPGTPHSGPLPPLTDEERALAVTLRRHVETVAATEHNVANHAELEQVARYIEGVLESYGFAVQRQQYDVSARSVRNVAVVIDPRTGSGAPETIVVGAHYDSAIGTPGANDNASGTAAVLELARLLRDLQGRASRRVRLLLFVNEEPPFFRTEEMGSFRYARALAEANERVAAMYSLETIGFYSDAPGSQTFPPPLGLLYPDRADFIAFVGLLNARPLVHDTVRSFRAHTAFPSIGGVAPGFIPGIDWSDHWAFAQHGFQAVMVTDTALFRYRHYHQPTDTPDKVDYEKVARVVKGMERVIRDLAR
jgi:hypothetical protein